MNKKIKISLLIIIMLFNILFYIKLIWFQQVESFAEQRKLAIFKPITVKSFRRGTSQTNIENVLADQMIFSEQIKGLYYGSNKEVLKKVQPAIIKITNTDCDYVELGNDVQYIPCLDSKYLVYKNNYAKPYSNQKMVEHFKKVETNKNIYYYIVSKDSSFNFLTDHEDYFIKYFTKKIKPKNISFLKITGFKDYIKYFYQTDHHWNNHGAKKAYLDLVKLLRLKNPIKLEEEICFEGVSFTGSKARKAGLNNQKEPFCVFKTTLPSHRTYVNGELKDYGHKRDYFNNQILGRNSANHYNRFYASEKGEVIYDYKQPEKPNLLMLVDSYADPVQEILASHFNKTYVVDLRSYNSEFNYKSYLQKNKISYTLFFGNAEAYATFFIFQY